MANNYYETLLNDIKIFIDAKDYLSAAKLINDEMQAPYIPKDIEIKLWEFNQIVNQNVKIPEQENFLTWNVNKVVEVMKQSLDQDLHLVAFDALRGLNARLIIPIIKEYLTNVNIKDEYKSFLMMILMEQKVDEEFLVNKNNGKVEIIFNPATFDVTEANKLLSDLEFQLETIVNVKNPSLYSVCRTYATTYFYSIFPIFRLDKFSINEVLAFIIIQAKKALGLEWENGVKDMVDYNEDKLKIFSEKNAHIFQ